jgi:eukaryotic-like serine/threonine-protein kinase
VARSDPVTTLRSGDTLGNYKLICPIGAGGMGRVWAARRLSSPTAQLVAIKTALTEFAADSDFERVFIDEARIASSIVHPNVCSIHEMGSENGIPYLVMEWIDGGSLHDVLARSKEHRIDFNVAARIVANASSGLHAAHELRALDGTPLHVVHRDVSPQNVLLSSKGHVKIADFGVARAKGQLHRPTETGELKGKLSYMAPEQLTSKVFDRRADVFALGCVLYQATTGDRPFAGNDALETMYRLLETDCEKPSTLVPDYPSALEAIVLRALHKDVEQRIQTAEELKNLLELYLVDNHALVTESEIARLIDETLGESIALRNQELAHKTTALALASRPWKGEDPQSSDVPISEDAPQTLHGLSQSPPPKKPHDTQTRLAFLAGSGAAAILTAVLFVTLWPFPKTQNISLAPSAPHLRDALPPASPSQVTVTLRAEPADARLQIDEGPTLELPHIIAVPADDTRHVVRATCPGYLSVSRTIIFDHTQVVVLVLPKLPPSSPSTSAHPTAVVTPGPRSLAAPTTPKPVGTNRMLPQRPKRVLDTTNPFTDP